MHALRAWSAIGCLSLGVALGFVTGCSEKASFTPSFDLGIDSLGYVILLQALEEEFNMEFPDEETMNLKTVEDAVKYIESKIQK